MLDRRSRKIIAEREDTAILIVDFQERLVPHIHDHKAILNNLIRIARASEIMKIPLLVAEQNPKGLGGTVPELEEHIGHGHKVEKISFSCFGEPKFTGKLRGLDASTLLVCGIEAHVCVAQTALHALLNDFQAHVLVDAIGSRNPGAAKTAINRMKEAGVVISCVEMAIFELLGRAGTPEFKEVQALVKN